MFVRQIVPAGAPEVNGTLEFLRVTPEGGEVPVGSPEVIRYSGTTADKIGLVLTAPQIHGFYRIVFVNTEKTRVGGDDLFVQLPSG